MRKRHNIKIIQDKTGLSYNDSYNLLEVHEYNLTATLNSIEYFSKHISNKAPANESINEKLIVANVYRKLKNTLGEGLEKSDGNLRNNNTLSIISKSKKSNKSNNVELVRKKTGLTYMDSYALLDVHNHDLDSTLRSIEYFIKYIAKEIPSNEDINEKLRNANVYGKFKDLLCKLNEDYSEQLSNNAIGMTDNKDSSMTINCTSIDSDNVKLVRQKTGLTYMDSYALLDAHNHDLDSTLSSIEYFIKYIAKEIPSNEDINEKLRNANVYGKFKDLLCGVDEKSAHDNTYTSNYSIIKDTKGSDYTSSEKCQTKTGNVLNKTTAVVAGVTLGGGFILYKVLANKSRKCNSLSQQTGLSREVSLNLLSKCNNLELALNSFENFSNYISSLFLTKNSIKENIKNAKAYKDLGNNLSKYNTMRGGKKGFKGFVFEEMHATIASINGQPTNVVGNNGISDFKITLKNSKVVDGQAKIGYRTKSVNWDSYKDHIMVIDKGNKSLISRAKKAGCEVIESPVTSKKAQRLSNLMQLETKVTGRKNSKIVPNAYCTKQMAKQWNQAGISASKSESVFGAGFSIGSNVIDVVDGDKTIKNATFDIAKDTVKATGTGYVVGATTSAIASSSIYGSATAAIASSSVGSAVGSAIAGATTAIASSAVGSSIVGGVAAATTAVAATPVIVTGVVAGAGYSVGKKILDKQD